MSDLSDLQPQAKKTVLHVYNYFKKLSEDGSNPVVAKTFARAQQMTAEACGVSLRTVERIVSEANKSATSGTGPSFAQPRKTYKRAKRVDRSDAEEPRDDDVSKPIVELICEVERVKSENDGEEEKVLMVERIKNENDMEDVSMVDRIKNENDMEDIPMVERIKNENDGEEMLMFEHIKTEND